MSNKVETKCKGRIGEDFTLRLVSSVYEEEVVGLKGISIKAALYSSESIEQPVQLFKGEASATLLINGVVAAKNPVYIDTKKSSEVSIIDYTTKIYSPDKSAVLDVELILEVEDESEYLTTTKIEDTVRIAPSYKDRLYIDLTLRESDELAYCTVTTTTEADFLEFKIDSGDWCRLNGISQFSFRKSGKDQYVQVRGRKDNYYSYSNVCRIFS